MAIGLRGTGVTAEEDSYLSDESDFYGDESTKQELEERTSSFDSRKWWARRSPTLMEKAALNLTEFKAKKTAKLYNPYIGHAYQFSRQLHETVDEFLQRVPPATTQINPLETDPWIRIANPYHKSALESTADQNGHAAEGPSDEDSNWARFVVIGRSLLEELTGIRHSIEKKNVGQAKSTITRALNIEKDKIVKKLLDTAVECRCTTGKWMIFSPVDEVNHTWSIIARATASNELGIATKIAPDEGETRKDRLICIYTKDFTDVEDVIRVVQKLKDLGLIKSQRGIYYKIDGYTFLGLSSNNDYNIKASLYNSNDVLSKKGEKKDAKLDGFFYKK